MARKLMYRQGQVSFLKVFACVVSPRLIPGIFTDVQKYSTLGNLRILNLNCVGRA